MAESARALRFQRLSEASVWDLQRKFYEQSGIDAWTANPFGLVPSYITSNAYVANFYANAVYAFLLDMDAAPTKTANEFRTMNIIEMASGSGKFAFLLLRSLERRMHSSPLAVRWRLRLVLTDLAQRNVDFWSTSKAFVSRNEMHQVDDRPSCVQVDFARFDAECDTELKLVRSGETLVPGLAM